jgi:MFS transporter, DHA2 family, multidrug resistance protein
MTAEVESSTQWKPKSNPWLIAATVALAAFMEVLGDACARRDQR